MVDLHCFVSRLLGLYHLTLWLSVVLWAAMIPAGIAATKSIADGQRVKGKHI